MCEVLTSRASFRRFKHDSVWLVIIAVWGLGIIHETLVAYEALHFGHLDFRLVVSINHGGGDTDHARSFPLRVPVLRRTDSPWVRNQGCISKRGFPKASVRERWRRNENKGVHLRIQIRSLKEKDSDFEFTSLTIWALGEVVARRGP